jgi:hypothetical protein
MVMPILLILSANRVERPGIEAAAAAKLKISSLEVGAWKG